MAFDLQRYAAHGADLRVRFFAANEALLCRAAEVLADAFRRGGKVLAFGNGGSAADAQHLAGELIGRFQRERDPLPAIALSTDTSVLTCTANDYGYEDIFARQIRALGYPGDVAWAISTSGDSPNILKAVTAAKEHGMAVIGLTGNRGALAALCDIALVVPEIRTPLVQEIHLAILHVICALLDDVFVPDGD